MGMSLAGIITLLQLVSAMLSNPTTAQNPQFQALATQAIAMAQNALSQSVNSMNNTNIGGGTGTATGVPHVPEMPVIINPPIYTSPKPVINSFCTLTASKLSDEDTKRVDHDNQQAGLNTRGPYYNISWVLSTDMSPDVRGRVLDMSSPSDTGTNIGTLVSGDGPWGFNKTMVAHDFKNLVGADFNGIKCYATPS